MNSFLFLFFAMSVSAQEFHLTPTDSSIHSNQIPEGIVVDELKENSTYLKPSERDFLLKKYFAKDIARLDEVERDLLYKAIIHYTYSRLVIKYPFMKKVDYRSLKNDIR